MSSTDDHGSRAGHSHGSGGQLGPEAMAILNRGFQQLLKLTEGMEFRPTASQRYPLPLSLLAYKQSPAPADLRQDIAARMDSDPVSVLENLLALLELYEVNQGDLDEHLADDSTFIGTCFGSKRCNGWISVVGDADRQELEDLINSRWQFRFFSGPQRPTGVYVLLNMLARYAFLYGRMSFGDGHALSHFVEDHCPGVLVCCDGMSDLELTLSLAAMKMGVPAVVPADYPFPLGRTIRYESTEQIPDAVVGFANIRRLLATPGIPSFPDYCDSENRKEKITGGSVWGKTPESYYIVSKGKVAERGSTVHGTPAGAIGIVVTIDAEPMDAFDRDYIERQLIGRLAMIKGVGVQYDGQTLGLLLAEGVDLPPENIGEVLLAAVSHDFPKLTKVSIEVEFDATRLAELAPAAAEEKADRRREMDNATEESVDCFYGCVGCSPFCPDHMCVLTPERPPQCGRSYQAIKTGALYCYDDMSNIHHSKLHRNVNSFIVVAKGECIDPRRGEWQGANDAASEYTDGRTTRLQIHALEDFPHTGCACFRMVMFTTDQPSPGVGIMNAGYEGAAPDGRTWRDLHYALTGKQAQGIAGCSPNYFRSDKFLKAHGGWDGVVWVAPKIADIMGQDLPDHVQVGPHAS